MTTQTANRALGWIAGVAFVLGCSVDAEDAEDASGAEDAEIHRDERIHPQLPWEAQPLVSCSQEADCSGGLACVAGTCRPCAAHAQCQSDVCDRSAATSLGAGACVPESAVVYVDIGSYPACELGDGSRANPACRIHDGITLAVGARSTVRVYPGQYMPFGASARTVRILGPGDGSAVVGEEDLSAGGRITSGANVLIDGLDFGVHVITGVVCDGSTLKLLRGSARGDYHGIRATNCKLEIDQVRVAGLIQSGLTIAGTGAYRVANSYFSGGDRPAVVLGGSSTGSFLFNTVRGGGELQPGGIDCGATPRVIRDSIVVGSAPAAGGAQTVGACTHQRVVVGSGDTRSESGLVKIDPDLDAEGRLLDTAASRACCIDRGARYVSGLYRDFFGTPRPQGASNDIGAHERAPAAVR